MPMGLAEGAQAPFAALDGFGLAFMDIDATCTCNGGPGALDVVGDAR